MTKTPSRPKPTAASASVLLRHYNSQVDAYNEAILAMPEKKRPETGLQQKFKPEEHADGPRGLEGEWGITRDQLVLLIRRQNHRLKRHIKRRALELLYEKVREAPKEELESGQLQADNGDRPLLLRDGKYTVGHTYQHILEVLRNEFPEASTSVACLRWYVVHERIEAVDEGLPWPDLPQVRPRSNSTPVAKAD